MVSYTFSCGLIGTSVEWIKVETDVSPGLPHFEIIGLPGRSANSARQRIRTAIRQTGYRFPSRRITVNLVPARGWRAAGPLDLAMAAGILQATGQIEAAGELPAALFYAELGLDGSLHPVPGVLSVLKGTAGSPFTRIYLPEGNRPQAAAAADNLHGIYCCSHLRQVISLLGAAADGRNPLRVRASDARQDPIEQTGISYHDLKDIRGQYAAKRALEIAAAGRHHLLLAGPPGSGKTLLAQSVPGILPELDHEEQLELSAIYSAAELIDPDRLWGKIPPFRAPHSAISPLQLLGGGVHGRLGEISLAHAGVLFLDELPEFRRDVLESLRVPMEEGVMRVWIKGLPVTLPAKFQLIAAMNLCPCSRLGLPEQSSPCRCTPFEIERYRKRISRAILDRIDLRVQVGTVAVEEWRDRQHKIESSDLICSRVKKAVPPQNERSARNGWLRGTDLIKACDLGRQEEHFMERAVEELGLSLRAHDAALRVARTIADLEGDERVRKDHLAEALAYQSFG